MTEETAVQGNVVATDAVPAVATDAPKAPKPKVVHYKIHLDATGTEMSREVLTKGRPPIGSYKDADGNLVCPFVGKKVRNVVMYVDLDATGTETGRREKGRGRPAPGYQKQSDGPLAGHWVKVVAPAVAVVATEAPAVAAPAEAPVAETAATE